MTKKSQKRRSVIEDKNGVWLTKPEKVSKRWFEYCKRAVQLYLFNIFIEQIMTEALEGFETAVLINGRPITNMRFDDDINLIADSMEKLTDLTERLAKASGKREWKLTVKSAKLCGLGRMTTCKT